MFGWIEERKCYWKRQPETDDEIALAIRVLQSQESDCHRYCGNDPRILSAVPEFCDYLPSKPAPVPNPTFHLIEHPTFISRLLAWLRRD